MTHTFAEHPVTLWMVDDVPVRMIHAGRRWRVTDAPTRVREPVWSLPLEGPPCMHGWRFQGADDTGRSVVFDVFSGHDGWHVHRAWE